MTHPTRVLAALGAATLLLTTSAFADDPAPRAKAAPEPVVTFSPFRSPLAPEGSTVYTDPELRASADLRYAGRIVAAFPVGTPVDVRTLYVGGDERLGPNPASFQLTVEKPGIGSVQVPVSVWLEGSRIVLKPLPPFAVPNPKALPDRLSTKLPPGQYTFGLFRGLKAKGGSALLRAPVFHSFVVGAPQDLAPRVVSTWPVVTQTRVAAGRDTPEVVVRFSEAVNPESVTPQSMIVRDIEAFRPAGAAAPVIDPAPGYPRVRQAEGGHEIVWRADAAHGGFPFGTMIEVTVRGAESAGAAIHDMAGTPLARSVRFTFRTQSPPTASGDLQAELKQLRQEVEQLRKELRELRSGAGK